MTVKTVARSPVALEIGAVVHDADGVSVSYEPVTMGPKVTVSDACGRLQHHVKCLAEKLLRTGEAVDTPSAEGGEDDDQALIGKTFTGSVVT